MWGAEIGRHDDRTPTHGYAATREAATGPRLSPRDRLMTAWRRANPYSILRQLS